MTSHTVYQTPVQTQVLSSLYHFREVIVPEGPREEAMSALPESFFKPSYRGSQPDPRDQGVARVWSTEVGVTFACWGFLLA